MFVSKLLFRLFIFFEIEKKNLMINKKKILLIIKEKNLLNKSILFF